MTLLVRTVVHQWIIPLVLSLLADYTDIADQVPTYAYYPPQFLKESKIRKYPGMNYSPLLVK
jgi:hypothetical protein